MTDAPSSTSLDELLAPLSPTLAAAVRPWCTESRFAEDRPAVLAMLGRVRAGDAAARAELEDAFSGPLPIGTGGRRGAVGPGPNRMNVAVVRETARGVAQMVRDEGAAAKVVVAYDTRTHSQAFADVVATQLADEGLDVLLVDAPRPTPQLSYLVRARSAGAGVVISASHNPPGDNGIKVYGPDGAQVLGPRDRALMAAIEHAMSSPPASAARRGAIERAETPAELAAVDDPYHAFVRAQGVIAGSLAGTIRVVYTPLHGVGHTAVLPVLRCRGLDVTVVESQLPDGGAFATVQSANPEVPAALAFALDQAEREGAELVLATDPDADRLGAAARNDRAELEFIDGNRLGVLMLDHVLRHASLPDNGWVLTTLVTSPLVATLARAAGVDVVDDLLVGFKHHAGMLAEAPLRPLVFACEESHGYVRGNDVHDKDGAVAALLLAECAAQAARHDSSLFAELDRIFMVHGYHRERTANIYAYGAAGRDAIARLVETWRRSPPEAFAGLAVVDVTDRNRPRATGSLTRDLPGNVLAFELAAAGGRACRLVVRPSGTEPKAKVYALGRGPASSDHASLAAVRTEIDRMVDAVLAEARARAEAVMGGGGG